MSISYSVFLPTLRRGLISQDNWNTCVGVSAMCRDFKGTAHSHRCLQLFWLIRPLIRLKTCGAMRGIMWGHRQRVPKCVCCGDGCNKTSLEVDYESFSTGVTNNINDGSVPLQCLSKLCWWASMHNTIADYTSAFPAVICQNACREKDLQYQTLYIYVHFHVMPTPFTINEWPNKPASGCEEWVKLISEEKHIFWKGKGHWIVRNIACGNCRS